MDDAGLKEEEVLTSTKEVYILSIMSKRMERDRLVHRAGINQRRASRAITNYYDRFFIATRDLRVTQIPALVVLYLAGPQTINEIAGRLDHDQTKLTRNLNPLEESGLVTTEPGADQRTQVVVLTEQGVQVLLAVLPVWEEAQAKVVQYIGLDRFQTLLGSTLNR